MQKPSKRLNFVGLILAVFIVLSPSVAIGFENSALFYANQRTKGTTISHNWSGYVAESSMTSPTSGFISSVKGSWTVPMLKSSSYQNSHVAIWVGIDGFSDGTVEQIGTDSEWSNGMQQNYAWIELYPNPSQLITSIAVHVGDQFEASVLFKGNNYYSFSIIDLTTGQSYSRTVKFANGLRQSAEWIVEAPSSNNGVMPLADFSIIEFSSARFTDSTNKVFAIDGRGTGTYDAIIIYDPTGGIAAPSVLTDYAYPQGSSNFDVIFGVDTVAQGFSTARRGGSPWILLI